MCVHGICRCDLCGLMPIRPFHPSTWCIRNSFGVDLKILCDPSVYALLCLRSSRSGFRFVGEFGGHGNMAAVRVAMHAALWRRGVDPLEVDPWYFPTPHEYRRLLEAVSVCSVQY